MTQYEIAIITLLAIEALTLYALWLTHLDREWFRTAWLREGTELLNIKREQEND